MRTVYFALVLWMVGLLGLCVAGTTTAEVRKLLQLQTKEQWEESCMSSHADRAEATSHRSPFAAKRLQEIGAIKALLITYPLPAQVARERETRPKAQAIMSAIRDVSLEPARPELMQRNKNGQRTVKITYSHGRDVQVVFVRQQPRYALIRASEDVLAIYAFTSKRSNQTMRQTATHCVITFSMVKATSALIGARFQ